jgi:hypothetical protein
MKSNPPQSDTDETETRPERDPPRPETEEGTSSPDTERDASPQGPDEDDTPPRPDEEGVITATAGPELPGSLWEERDVKLRSYLSWSYVIPSRQVKQLFFRIRVSLAELDQLAVRVGWEEGEADPDMDACYGYLMTAMEAIGLIWRERSQRWEWDAGMVGNEDVVSAYHCLYAARRELIRLRYRAATAQAGPGEFESEEERPASPSERVVYTEATKVWTKAENELSGGPLDTVRRLLTDGSTVAEGLGIGTVIEARHVYDEQVLEKMETDSVLERQNGIFLMWAVYSTLGALLLAVTAPYLASFVRWVSGWGFFAGFGSGGQTLQVFGPSSAAYGATFLVAVALFGLLGASISGMLTLRGVSTSTTRSLRSIDIDRLAYARLAVGVGMALGLVILVESGIPAGIFAVDVEFTEPAQALVVAFLGGFSERLLPKALGRLTGQKEAEAAVPAMLRSTEKRSTGSQSR